MIRLESLAAGGYFPTPPRVADAIARHLAPANAGRRGTVRILDPCAGTGAAVARLAAALGAESYGVDLHEGRAAAARDRLDHTLAGDAFAIRCANRAFSVLFANPPYDDTGDERRRLEHAFLTGLTRTLASGGLLILIVPQRRLELSARYLASHYRDHAIFRFPDPEWAAYAQVVLFAQRRETAWHDAAAEARIRGWARGDLSPPSGASSSPAWSSMPPPPRPRRAARASGPRRPWPSSCGPPTSARCAR